MRSGQAPTGQSDPVLPAGVLESPAAELAAYLFVEPWVDNRTVLDVAPPTRHGAERLRQSGARRVETCTANAHPLPYADATFDVVLGLGLLPALPLAVEREARVREIARVLRPDGFCVLRIGNPACPLHPPERTCLSREALANLLAKVFPVLTLVSQTPMLVFSFEAPEASELAVNETLASMSTYHTFPSFHLAFASQHELPGEMFREKLLTPFARPLLAEPASMPKLQAHEPTRLPSVSELERRLFALQRERDSLHESLMSVEDERDRLRQTVASLRRENERYLRQISEQAATLELLEDKS